MPLLLTDLATEQPVRPILRPTPGSEKLEDGTRILVAALAPVASGWIVIPLRPADEGCCAVNGEMITATKPIAVGDELSLGQKDFRVVEATSDLAAFDGDQAPGSCAVSVRWRGQEVNRITTNQPILIGTAADCKIVLPADSGLAPYHALLAHVTGRWVLFVFPETGVARDDASGTEYTIPVVRDESVWLGDTELTVLYDEVDPLDHAYPDVPRIPAETGSSDTQNLHHETESGSEGSLPSANTPVQHWRMTAVSARRDNSLHLRGIGLCQWLQQEHERIAPSPRPKSVGTRAFPLKPSPLTGSSNDLEQFAERLRATPWDPDLLFEIADYLRRLGMTDSARWMLKEIYRQNPSDAVVAESLAVVAWEQSRDSMRTDETRLADLKRAYKYATIASRLRPATVHLIELQRAIGSDLTLRQMGPATRRSDSR